jgi:transcriptional/translational regulatory protein YebC/TACO1
MGRIFEKRKHKMFARYDKMAKAFTRIGKEIAIAVKQGGPDPDGNPRLRAAMRNAKALNMPKDRIEAAIKRAVSKDAGDFSEVVYEGYGPYGVAILIETATDNTTRTVANVRMHLTRGDGSLGKTGSLDFIFERKALFNLNAEGLDVEELELELIPSGGRTTRDVGCVDPLEDRSLGTFLAQSLEETAFGWCSRDRGKIADPRSLSAHEQIEQGDDALAVGPGAPGSVVFEQIKRVEGFSNEFAVEEPVAGQLFTAPTETLRDAHLKAATVEADDVCTGLHQQAAPSVHLWLEEIPVVLE